jgi:hypothetical protein
VSLPLSVTKVGDEYRVLVDKVALRFRSLTSHHDGPTAILEVVDMLAGGRPHVDRLALLSSRTRATLAKTLAIRWGDHPWSVILDDACHAVYEAFSAGEPAESLEPEEPDETAWLVDGLIPLDATTVLYADGGSLKSWFALALGVAALRNEPLANSARWCVRRRRSVLYLDWETDRRTHGRRLYRLLAGLGLESCPEGLAYMRLAGRPLHISIQSVAGEVSRLGADLVIVDSLGLACGDEPETAAANLRTLGVLSTLPTTKLVVTHVNAQTAVTPNGPGRPYGSVYVRNVARSAIEARSEPQGDGRVLVTYYHRKANDTELAETTALTWCFSKFLSGPVTVEVADPDLQHATLPERIEQALGRGAKSATLLAEELGTPANAIRATLGRMEKRNTVVRIEEYEAGRGKKGMWGLIDRKRNTLGD